MINLIRAELLRFRARRLTLVLGIVLLGAVIVFQVVVGTQVRPLSASDRADQQASYQAAHDDWQANHVQQEKECTDQGQTAEECAQLEPELTWFGRTPVPFSALMSIGVSVISIVSILLLYLLSASLMGAEFSSGSLSNWLTFVPNRFAVLGSKLIALAIVAAVGCAAALFVTIGAAAAVTSVLGADVTGVETLAAIAGRAVVLAVFFSVLAFCFALITRHTIAALGVVLGYLILQLIIQIISAFAPSLAHLQRIYPDKNAQAFLAKKASYQVYDQTSAQGFTDHTITLGQSSLYFGVLLVVVVAVSTVIFSRRDVT